MNIIFENSRAENEVRNYDSGVRSNVDRVTASHVNSQGVFALDISGTVMDNTAYEGQGKTAEDVMQDAGQMDVATQKNYMAVMSNIMSDEDFAKLQKEGFHPGNTEIEKVVTIVDEIKAALVRGGNNIVGYTDDLDVETLTQITGSAAFAESIMKQFGKYDIPVTRENVEDVMKACDEVTQLNSLSDGVMKYMIRNRMEPTIDNIYRAQYSAMADADKQGRGYYQDDAGYYAKKAEGYNWQQLRPQMEKVIEQAGLTISEETIGDAKWLIEKGVPLTEESLHALYELKNLEIPGTAEEIVSAASAAIADGKKAGTANVADGRTALEKAVDYMEDVNSISDEAVDQAAAAGRKLNLRNLKASQIQLSISVRTENYAASLNDRRLMEEVRLQMTVEANLRLIKRGFSVDTAQLEQLVDALKTVNQQTEETLFGESSIRDADGRSMLYKNTISTVRELAGMPAALVGKLSSQSRIQISMTSVSSTKGIFTLQAAYEEGTVLRNAYEKARESYETLMAAPRADLGDSVKKAFRNVDDLLKDMNMEISEANRRAVRILGYNRMEISEENVAAVKTADLTIQRVLEKMTPASTMQMIRDGRNPLAMDMQELETYLNNQERNPEQEFEKYSEYLYKLERNHSVTESERDAYIGIYRLFRQLEKTDGAAIGALLQQGAEPTVKNLLSAMRSSKKRGMDVTVDDGFVGMESSYKGKSISEQIEGGIRTSYYQKLAADIYDRLDGGRMNAVPADGDVSLEQFAQMLRNAQPDEEADRMYVKQQASQFRQEAVTEDAVIREILDYDQPVTANNLLAAGLLMKERGKAAGRLYELADENGHREILEEAMANVWENMTDEDSAKEAYGRLEQVYKDVLETVVYGQEAVGKIDIREISGLYKQISFSGSMAKEENYEIPVKIGGEVTSINLKIVHNDGESGKVTATMDTKLYGKIAAQFQLSGKDNTERQLSGYIACENKQAMDTLEQFEEGLKKKLESADIKIGNLNFIYNRELNLSTADQTAVRENVTKAAADAQQRISTKKLYETAKIFIEYMQER